MTVQYLPEFRTRDAALARSAEIATAAGCGRHPDDVTRYWFAVVEHPANDRVPRYALEVTPGEEARLIAEERTKLQDRNALANAGWFEREGDE